MHHPAYKRLAAGLLALSVSLALTAALSAAPSFPAAAASVQNSDQGVAPGPAIAVAVSVKAESAKTVFTVLLSKPVTAQATVMERPDRVILDLPEVTFRLPTEPGRKREGLISSFRYGLFAPGRSRVVMDLAQPALVSRIATQANPADGTSTLVVELIRADRDAFRKAASESSAAAATPTVVPETTAAKDRRPVIVLDPGHGGIDPGAAATTGVYEKDIVFAFAQRLRTRLERDGRYQVVLTRDKDVFIPLGERVRAARKAGADLFVSVHADTISGAGEVRGLTVYTGSERASDADSAQLADRENRADATAGLDSGDTADDISDILQDLTLRETRGFSHTVAERLVGELRGVARLNKNPHREAGFRVLRAFDIPSVLIELGYLSSRQDFDLMMSDDWRGKATDAIAAAVDRFFVTRLAVGGAAPVSP
jgi:N-acetylmuramoyl-L-alanine amidase